MYGPVSPTGAPYTVQLDNGEAQYFTSNRAGYTPQMLLYQATNLGLGSHKVKMTLQLTAPFSQYLSIDYARVYTTFQSRCVHSFSRKFLKDDAIPSVYTSGNVSSGGVSTGIVVGVAFAAFALGFFVVSALGFILLRRREAQARKTDEKLQVQPFNPPRPEVVTASALGSLAPSGSDPNLRNLSPHTRNHHPFQVGSGMRKDQSFGRQPDPTEASSSVS